MRADDVVGQTMSTVIAGLEDADTLHFAYSEPMTTGR